MQLRDYQVRAVEAVEAALREGIRRPVVAMATGLGKTIVFAELIRRRGGRALVLAHRDELVRQAKEKVEAVTGRPVGVVEAAEDDWQADMVVASVQSLRPRRLQRWEPDRFQTLVVDECHHAVAPSYTQIFDYLTPELLLGVTATPFRGDMVSLEGVFDKIVFAYGLKEGIRSGYLVDIEAYRVKSGVSLDKVRTVAGDFAQGDLAETVDTPERNALLVEAYRRHADGMKTLVFTVSVEHALHVAQTFWSAGIPAAYVHGGMKLDERRAVLEKLRSGELRVVANCNVLTEGFDEPSVEAIILARPTKSLALFTQMVGRGTRPHPGKDRMVLIDVVDTTRRHKLVTVEELVGLHAPVRPGARVMKAVEEEERGIAELERFVLAVAPEFDVEKVENLLADFEVLRSPVEYDWREVADGLEEIRETEQPELLLATSGRVLPLNRPATDAQRVALRRFGWPEEELEGLSMAEASWAIERHMRASRARAVVAARREVWRKVLGEEVPLDFEAPWQMAPATEKQLRYLRRLGVPLPEGPVLAGEASALIDRALRLKEKATV